ncbi:hypothetical protein Hanom_Chr06g00480051 [Helianthus anomalus]
MCISDSVMSSLKQIIKVSEWPKLVYAKLKLIVLVLKVSFESQGNESEFVFRACLGKLFETTY